MATSVRIYWWTPIMMVLSLLSGVLFALGHHLFYNSLVDRPTSTNHYTIRGTQHPGQQVNIAIGTAFAFLVKAAFVLAVSTAYYQVFWKRAKHDSRVQKPPILARLDTTFSGTTNFVSLLNVPVWFRYPLLFFMACTVWLIPIASIITPATLSVDLRENIAESTTQQVAQIDFFNLNFLAGMPSPAAASRYSLLYVYNGPSQIVKRIAVGVAAQNSILPIAAPFPNSSWELEFNGPSIKCDPISSSESLNFQANIAQYIKSTPGYCKPPATYLAWFPRINTARNESFNEPYIQSTQGNASFPDPETIFNTEDADFSNVIRQDAIMYISIMPNMLSVRRSTLAFDSDPLACELDDDQQVSSENPLGSVGGNITMLQCRLYNSTYHTKFDYVNGAQTVSINLVRQGMDNTVSLINLVRGAGSGGSGSGKCATLNYEDGKYGKPCDFDKSLLSQLSYQATLQPFASLVTGNITMSPMTNVLSDSTDIRSTSLLDTRELDYLTDYALHASTSEMDPDLQKSLRGSNNSEVSGMTRLEQTTSNRSLQDAIEIMFQNFTVSLMSSSALQPDYSSAGAPPKTLVTQFTSQTVYVYAANKLWAAYGVAAVFTLGSVIIGILTILADGASYSNAFSTVLRVARAAELSIEVQESDLDGRDPLPTHLAKATVAISGGKDRGWTPITPEDSAGTKGPTAETTLLA
ncbi:MAG: hypothetical protein M1812_007427 [Candelaria pacifica]|nr:MAG: hypothetical protein M1812_007427 [Candelaria pacifica]